MPALTQRLLGLSTVALLATACQSAPPAPTPPAAAEAPAPVPAPAAPEASADEETSTILSEPEPTPEPDPATKAKAQALYEEGQELFRQGRYDEAEMELKEALNLYPFMARANLALGKVFLIRGAAVQDEVMIDSARLMFTMALSIDPSLREADVLLSLFKNRDAPPVKGRAEPPR